MRLLLPLIPDGVTPEISRPAPDRLVSGDPVHLTWNLEEADGLFCGLWQSSPGAWKVRYSEWEFVHIVQGVSILHETGGPSRRLVAGDSWIIRPGFDGIWDVQETTLKHYVIRL